MDVWETGNLRSAELLNCPKIEVTGLRRILARSARSYVHVFKYSISIVCVEMHTHGGDEILRLLYVVGSFLVYLTMVLVTATV
jgi:hypothetical protein